MLKRNGVELRFIDSPEFNTDVISGKLTITVLGAVAEFKRETIKHRQTEGITQASKRGVDSTSRVGNENWETAKGDLDANVSKTKIAQQMNISKTTL